MTGRQGDSTVQGLVRCSLTQGCRAECRHRRGRGWPLYCCLGAPLEEATGSPKQLCCGAPRFMGDLGWAPIASTRCSREGFGGWRSGPAGGGSWPVVLAMGARATVAKTEAGSEGLRDAAPEGLAVGTAEFLDSSPSSASCVHWDTFSILSGP